MINDPVARDGRREGKTRSYSGVACRFLKRLRIGDETTVMKHGSASCAYWNQAIVTYLLL